MSSGQPRVIQNTRERVISNDQNLAQDYIASARAQALRRLHNRPAVNRHGYENPGLHPDLAALPTSDNGTVHDVFSGLMVRPDNATSLLIDPGSAGFVVPGWPGLVPGVDSPYIVVDDAGVDQLGVLPFTANGSGNPRIDIVECRPVDQLVSSQNRDVWQPSTNDFTPQTVEKIRTARLEYRVRLGNPNDGFPAIDQGWCPLAFVVVQSGAAGFDTCDVYDVRPLVSERSNAYASVGVSLTPISNTPFESGGIWDRAVTPANTSTTPEVTGWFRGEYNGYYIGGTIRRNTPSTTGEFAGGTTGDRPSFLLGAAANQAQGSAAPSAVSGSVSALVAIVPRGLGRCVRYSQGPVGTAPYSSQVALSGRLPQGANGILFLASYPNLTPSGAVVVNDLPSTFGTNVAGAYTGVVVGWAIYTGTRYLPFYSAGKRHNLITVTATYASNWGTIPATPFTTANVSTDLVRSGSSAGLAWGTPANRGNVPNTAKTAIFHTNLGISKDNAALSGPVTEVAALRVHGVAVDEVNYGSKNFLPAVNTNPLGYVDVVEIPLVPHTTPYAGGAAATTVSRNIDGRGSNSITNLTATFAVMGWEDY